VERVLAFEHIFDEDAALSNFLVDNKLFVIGGDEEDHCYSRWIREEKGDGVREEEGEKTESDRAEMLFSRAWSFYVSLLPFRTRSPLPENKENDLV
jgi:hypothetical protein